MKKKLSKNLIDPALEKIKQLSEILISHKIEIADINKVDYCPLTEQAQLKHPKTKCILKLQLTIYCHLDNYPTL